jgi:aryl-phospho-beta-D-glucosidase BglC (GH1 family)
MRTQACFLALFLVTLSIILGPVAHASPAQGFLSTQGTSIIDSSGHEIVLRGVNYPGYQGGDPQPHNPYAYYNFAQSGFNVVRLPISWANLEPRPGIFDMSYLTSFVDQDVRWAKAAGIYVILDMHQIYWAEKFGGYGAPAWTVQAYAPDEVGMREAVSDFWANMSLQEHFLSVWTMIAQHYANETAIAGYDILNEPFIYTSVLPGLNATYVDAFYGKAIQAIRNVDTSHLIILEPANLDDFKLPPTTNLVWSPHFYQLAFVNKYYPQNYTLLESDIETKYMTFVVNLKEPMWIGEFGSSIPDSTSSATWTQDVVSLLNQYQIGWAWWAYYGSVPTQLYTTS